MKVSFIGYGNMAKAIAQGLIHNKEYQLFAVSPSLTKGVNSDGITTNSDIKVTIDQSDIVILAVKPQQIEEVLNQIGLHLPLKCLLISVAAGVSISSLEKYCRKDQAIIRSMPNMAVALGKGATPLSANSKVTPEQRQMAEHLFQYSGIIQWTEVEAEMDIFTALSGSGPAYVFLFMEAMMTAAEKLGLNQKVAKTFTLQTVDGALQLAKHSQLEISELRNQVTSPSGTTAAALTVFKKREFENIILEAMRAALERAKQLGL